MGVKYNHDQRFKLILKNLKRPSGIGAFLGYSRLVSIFRFHEKTKKHEKLYVQLFEYILSKTLTSRQQTPFKA